MGKRIRSYAWFSAASLALLLGPVVVGTYAQNILTQSFLFAIVALTVDLLWGYTGILTFGQSAFFGVGAYSVGLVYSHVGNGAIETIAAVVMAAAIAALASGLIGWFAFWHRASPLFITVVTFAVPVILVQVILSGGALTGSSSGLSGFPTFNWSFEQWYWATSGMLLLIMLCMYIFVNSDASRVLIAIRESEDRCRYLGIKVSEIKIALLMICGAIAAIAGAAYAMFADVVAPGLADFVLGTQFVIWVALGGRGTLVGPIVATILINLVSALLSGNLPFLWLLFIGFLFVVVVVYMPQGFFPELAFAWTAVQQAAVRRAGAGCQRAPGSAPEIHLTQAAVSARGADPAADHEPPALELRSVSRRYGSLSALSDVSLKINRGELVGIVGPNGAGKTTLMRCVSDGRERTSGTVIINGHDIGRNPPRQCVAFGLGRKFQTANVFDSLNVRDCLRVARTHRSFPSVWGTDRRLELPEPAMRVVETTALVTVLDLPARQLSHGMKQALELAMVLALEPSVLLLDEPTAGLSGEERASIGRVFVDLARDHRLCIVLVEHDLDFVRNVSSRIIVLHQGRILMDGSVADVVGSKLVRDVYVGARVSCA